MSEHPCAYHYLVEPPHYWCEVCGAFKKPVSKQLTDADKLLAVCRVVWPDHTFDENNGVVCAQTWPEGRFPFCLADDSLDDLRRVLLALTPGQRGRFANAMVAALDASGHPPHDPLLYETLTAPTSTILDALHRAVCPE